MVYNIHVAESIRVLCRIRPFHGNEKRAHPGPIVAPQSDQVVVKARGKMKAYHFDKVYLPKDSQGTNAFSDCHLNIYVGKFKIVFKL